MAEADLGFTVRTVALPLVTKSTRHWAGMQRKIPVQVREGGFGRQEPEFQDAHRHAQGE